MSWPDSLVREIVEKRCILHLGSGLSCQSVDDAGNRPPSWSSLLRKLGSEVLDKEEDKNLVEDFINEHKFLDAAEVIKSKGREAEYIAKLRECYFVTRYLPSEAHRAIVEILPKILVTTNYDLITERILNDLSGLESYIQFDHTKDGLLDSVKSPHMLYVKLHGCAKHAQDTILSRSDYFKLRDKYSKFFDTISALYKINTVLFIGCGIEDPDINLILENNRIQSGGASPNYALVGSLSYAAKIKESIKSQYNIELILFEQEDANDYSQFEPFVLSLRDAVLDMRAKFGQA